MKTLRIRNWRENFENNRTRELKRMDWVPISNKMDNRSYIRLVAHPNGPAHLGAWLALVEIASRCDPRGTLPWEGAEIPQALAEISRIPAVLFDEVIPRLADLKWIEEVTAIPQDGAGKPHQGAEIPQDGAPRARAGMEGKEGNGSEGKRAPIISMPPAIDYGARYRSLYDKHISPGFQQEGEYEYGKIIASAMKPELTADAIDAAHVEWMTFFRENPNAYRPGIGKWLKDGYWSRHPDARASPVPSKYKRDIVSAEELAEYGG